MLGITPINKGSIQGIPFPHSQVEQVHNSQPSFVKFVWNESILKETSITLSLKKCYYCVNHTIKSLYLYFTVFTIQSYQ